MLVFGRKDSLDGIFDNFIGGGSSGCDSDDDFTCGEPVFGDLQVFAQWFMLDPVVWEDARVAVDMVGRNLMLDRDFLEVSGI